MVEAGLWVPEGTHMQHSVADKVWYLTESRRMLEAGTVTSLHGCDEKLGLSKSQLGGFLKWLRQGRLGEHKELTAYFELRSATTKKVKL